MVNPDQVGTLTGINPVLEPQRNSDFACCSELLFIMKLTLILFRRNRLPNGSLFRGKDRLVKKVEPVHLRRLQEDFAVEEKNMLYLRHPYLTEVCIYLN